MAAPHQVGAAAGQWGATTRHRGSLARAGATVPAPLRPSPPKERSGLTTHYGVGDGAPPRRRE
eukprot:1781543-Prymnesium_polylepis.1